METRYCSVALCHILGSLTLKTYLASDHPDVPVNIITTTGWCRVDGQDHKQALGDVSHHNAELEASFFYKNINLFKN